MHTIRLRGPWEFQVLMDQALPEAKSVDLPSGKVKMPSDCREVLGNNFQGSVRYTRKFNRPTGLEIGTQVHLCVTAVGGPADIFLNDHSLAQMREDQMDQRFEITEFLQLSNQLTIIVERPLCLEQAPLPTSGLIGEVRLEIIE